MFQGLLGNAHNSDTYVMMNAKQRPSILFALNAKQGLEGAVWSAFPLVAFERAVVSCLAEIKPEDVLPPTAPSKALAVAGQLAAVEKRLLKLKALLRETDEAEELVQTVRDLSAERTRLQDALEAEKGREAAPLAEAWGAVKPLAEAMDEQGWSEDARIRLKAAVGPVRRGNPATGPAGGQGAGPAGRRATPVQGQQQAPGLPHQGATAEGQRQWQHAGFLAGAVLDRRATAEGDDAGSVRPAPRRPDLPRRGRRGPLRLGRWLAKTSSTTCWRRTLRHRSPAASTHRCPDRVK